MLHIDRRWDRFDHLSEEEVHVVVKGERPDLRDILFDQGEARSVGQYVLDFRFDRSNVLFRVQNGRDEHHIAQYPVGYGGESGEKLIRRRELISLAKLPTAFGELSEDRERSRPVDLVLDMLAMLLSLRL